MTSIRRQRQHERERKRYIQRDRDFTFLHISHIITKQDQLVMCCPQHHKNFPSFGNSEILYSKKKKIRKKKSTCLLMPYKYGV